MSKAQHDAKKAADLKAALAEKPPTPGFFAAPEDYVPPPVVNLQDKIPLPRRRPLQSELPEATERAREQAAVSLEETKVDIALSTRIGSAPPTAEATERAHLESVRQLKVQFAKRAQAFDVEDKTRREVKAHADNLDYVKAEMARAIHTEDYSG